MQTAELTITENFIKNPADNSITVTYPAELRLQFACALNSLYQYREDPEYLHIKADQYLCQLLTALGFSEGVEIFKALPKYYS